MMHKVKIRTIIIVFQKRHEKIVSQISGMPLPSAFGYAPGNFTVEQAS